MRNLLQNTKVKAAAIVAGAGAMLASAGAWATGTVDPNFSTAMQSVQDNATATISAALPFIFTIVGAVVVLNISKKLVRKAG